MGRVDVSLHPLLHLLQIPAACTLAAASTIGITCHVRAPRVMLVSSPCSLLPVKSSTKCSANPDHLNPDNLLGQHQQQLRISDSATMAALLPLRTAEVADASLPPLPPAPLSSSSPSSSLRSPQKWEVEQVSGTKRRHRSEVDSRRRQREAELLRRLLSLSSPHGSLIDEEGDDVVEVLDEDGRLRRRRLQKLDVLERATATIERLQNLVHSALVQPSQPSIPDADDAELHPSVETAALPVAASEVEAVDSASQGLNQSLHSALSNLQQRWGEHQLELPLSPGPVSSTAPFPSPAATSGSSASSAPYDLALPHSDAIGMAVPQLPVPSPTPLELPLSSHIHRSVAEWYEEAYRRSWDLSLLRLVAFHWLQAVKADSDSPLSSSPSSSLSSSSYRSHSFLVSSRSSSPTVDVPQVDVTAAVISGSGSHLPCGLPPSQSALIYCRHRAIHWLREAATATVGKGVQWDVVKWLRRAAELIDELPDHRSFRWRRELLRVLSLYCSSYSCFVGVTQSVAEWCRLCRLCDEVQQRLSSGLKQGKTKRDVASALALTTFYALRGYHLALNASTRSPIDLAESARTSAHMQAIADAHPSYLVQTHALYVQAIEHIHHGQYDDTIRLAHQAWQLCAEHYPPHCAFTVNPLAPVDPGVGALCCASNALCLLGRLSEAVEHADRCVRQASLNAEPVTCQWVLGMRCYMLSQLEEFGSHGDHFLAYLHQSRASEQGPISTLYETVLALYRISEEPQSGTPEAVAQLASACWGRYEKGDSFIIAFSSPLCELLSRAGMWREGLRLIDDWQSISQQGEMSFYYPNCHRYRARFLLQQADALEREQPQPSGGLGEGGTGACEERELYDHHAQDELSSPLLFVSSNDWPASPALTVTDEGFWHGFLSPPTPPLETTRLSTTPLPSAASAVHLLLRKEAVQCLREAIAAAEKQRARLLEMKAIMDLLTLLDELGLRTVALVQPPLTNAVSTDSQAYDGNVTLYRERLRRLLAECSQSNEGFTVIQRAQLFTHRPA